MGTGFTRITNLPVASSVGGSDVTVINQGGFDFQATFATILQNTLQSANNLNDLQSIPTARTNLGALAKAGDTMTGALILNADPTNPLGAVTKQYADAISAGLTVKQACYAASVSALTVTYNNLGGIGDTLTNAASQATFALDGVNPPLNSRVLIKNQASQIQNGIYTVTNVGSGVANWVLTRALDYDTASEIQPGNMIIIDNGSVNQLSSWVQTATVSAVGSSNIIFSQFSGSAGSFLQVANNLSDVASRQTSLNNINTASPVQGMIVYYNGSNWVPLGAGTSGKFLQTQGTSANPVYATALIPANNLSDVSSQQTSLNNIMPTSPAQGDVVYYNGTNWVRLAAGTSNNFLQTKGGAANPQWSAALLPANNLSDVSNASTAVTNLGAVHLNGDTMTGALILNADPVTALGAATKQYVDAGSAASSNCKVGCYAATTANLVATYSNGSSGVGATLTNNSTLAAFSVDGVSPSVNARILVKNQSSSFQNGIYTLTTVGSGAVAWVLTRSTDYNNTSQILPGNLLIVDNGTANTLTQWIQTGTVNTIGSDSIVFSQFTGSSSGGVLLIANNLSDVNNKTTSFDNISPCTTQGDVIYYNGTHNVRLAAGTSGNFLQTQGSSANPVYAQALIPSNNLSDVSSASSARTNLGLGTAATHAATDFCATANNLSDVANTSTAVTNLGAVHLNGDTMTGLLVLSADPSANLGAATKQYVDAVSNTLSNKQSVVCATTANLTATYSNGTAGVGATLTNSGTLVAFSTDGQSPSANARVLVKNQSTAANNGIYSLTTVGSGAVAWVLTRVTDYDTPTQMVVGTFVLVEAGTANASTEWMLSGSVTTVGTTAANFTQISAPPSTFLQVANNLSDVNSKTTSFDNISPLTTQGDVIYYNGTHNVRLAAGTINYPLLTGGAGANPNFAQLPVGSISATGTPSSTTYLRGDGTWSTVSSGANLGSVYPIIVGAFSN